MTRPFVQSFIEAILTICGDSECFRKCRLQSPVSVIRLWLYCLLLAENMRRWFMRADDSGAGLVKRVTDKMYAFVLGTCHPFHSSTQWQRRVNSHINNSYQRRISSEIITIYGSGHLMPLRRATECDCTNRETMRNVFYASCIPFDSIANDFYANVCDVGETRACTEMLAPPKWSTKDRQSRGTDGIRIKIRHFRCRRRYLVQFLVVMARFSSDLVESNSRRDTNTHTHIVHISQTTTCDDGRGIVAIIECRVREFMRKMISSTSDDGTTKVCLCLALRFVCLRLCLCAKCERGKQHLNRKISPSSFTLCTQTGIRSHTSAYDGMCDETLMVFAL